MLGITMRHVLDWRKVVAASLVLLSLWSFHYKLSYSRIRIRNDAAVHPVPVDLKSTTVQMKSFEGFNNETGAKNLIVPNIIHYIRFNKTTFNFIEYVCIRSAYVNHRPQHIFIHTNVKEFSGEFWDKIKKEPDFYDRIRILAMQVPSKIFGQKLSSDWQLYHGSDVARIRTIMKYGGIYLDNDMYVVSNLHKYRRFEIAMAWDEDQFLGNQIIIAHKNARFLPLYLDCYKKYVSDKWYYNAGERPTVELLFQQPELLHRVKLKFGVHILTEELYNSQWDGWRQLDTIHLLINHRYYLDPHFEEYPTFDQISISNYSYTFGIMAREIML